MRSSTSGTLFAVVMAGGAGTRFWPLSRRRRPKQLLPLLEGRSLLAATVDRLAPLVPSERTWIVTVADVAEAVRAEVPQIPADNVLVEPVGRDTAACVGWAVWRLARSNPDATMVMVPADHVIHDSREFRKVLSAAATCAARRGGLVTLGIKPTRPETGFGYLQFGTEVERVEGIPIHRVSRFVEKPDRATAESYLAAGSFRWNAGIFAWTVAAMESAIREHLPELATRLDAMLSAATTVGEHEAIRVHYPGLPRISVDFGVMEKASTVWGVAAEFGWSDIGSWLGLAEVLPKGEAGVGVGNVLALDSSDCVLVSEGPLLTVLGARDLVVVATSDAVLVVPKERAQQVKALVDRLHELGRDELL